MRAGPLLEAERLQRRRDDLVAGLRAVAQSAGIPSCIDDADSAAVIDGFTSRRPDRVVEALTRVGAAQSAVNAGVLGVQLDSLARIRHELAMLERHSQPSDVLAGAPRAACRACGFDRALISRVRGSRWYPVTAYVASQATTIDEHHDDPFLGAEIRLAPPLPEAEIIRRRTPALVSNAQHDPRLHRLLVERTGTREYVAVPVQVANAVVGLLHADCHTSGRPLSVLDRDRLHSFASALGLLVETSLAQQQLEAHDLRVRQLVSDLSATADEPDWRAQWRVERRAVASDRCPPVTTHGLTRREFDVLRLLAGGVTNAEIASRLTVSETTVKSHVKHILRKLQVPNRAGAVAKYLESVREMQEWPR